MSCSALYAQHLESFPVPFVQGFVLHPGFWYYAPVADCTNTKNGRVATPVVLANTKLNASTGHGLEQANASTSHAMAKHGACFSQKNPTNLIRRK